MHDVASFNLPLVAPALRLPPYRYNHVRRISIVLETEPERIKAILPEPLEYVGNRYVVWLEHRVDQNPGPAPAAFAQPYDTYEASVDIPVRYKDLLGTHIPMMWVPTSEADFARALAGRELQGIGKKMAHFQWDERVIDNEILATMTRNGIPVIRCHLRLGGKAVDLPTTPPVISLKVAPRIDGSGFDLKKVVALDSWDVKVARREPADVVSFEVGESDEDPLYRLKPTAVLGAMFTIWSGSTEQPCGRELADLLSD